MSAEEITLCLNEIGRKQGRGHIDPVIIGGAESAQRHPVSESKVKKLPYRRFLSAQLVSYLRERKQVRVLAEAAFKAVHQRRLDDAAIRPYPGYRFKIKIPGVLLGGRIQKFKTLLVVDQPCK
jgi:hypothetical protein